MTVTIYKITQKSKAFDWERDEFYSISPWDDVEYPYHGYDDGGRMYQLPFGFKIKYLESRFHDGVDKVIFDTIHQKECQLIDDNGTPAILDTKGNIHRLTVSAVDSFFRI